MSGGYIPTTVEKRITTTLFTTQSLFAAAMIASFTLMPIISADLAGSDSAAGIPNTVNLLARAAFALPLGWLMDRIGRRLGLSVGFMIAVAGFIASVFALLSGSFLGFCLGAGLVGVGRAVIDQGRYVAAEIQPVENRAKAIGFIVFAGTVGAVGGPLVVAPTSALSAAWGLPPETGPYWFGALACAVGLLLTFFLLRPDPLLLSKRFAPVLAAGEVEEEKRPLREIYAQPLAQLAVAAMVIAQLVMTLIMVITPLHMSYLHHTTAAISAVIMAHTLGMFGLSSLTGWLIDRFGRISIIIVGAMILIISSLLTPLAGTVALLALALFLLGLGWNFCFIAGSSLLSDTLRTTERGQAQGASDTLVALGSGVGSFATGAVFAAGGIIAVSGAGLAFTLALFGILLWLRLANQPQPGY
ncbi:MAG: MFS transporter [Chloroflexota bacterium]